jgi:hypothetical protein
MSRKLLVTLILILLLLPFVSWYYLQSGLEWRKKAQEIMNGTKPFPSGEYFDIKGKKFSHELLNNHVSIVTFLPCKEEGEQMTVLREIYNQFKDTQKANFILLDSCSASGPSTTDETKQNWFVIPCIDTLPLCSSFRMDWPEGKSFALVDRKGIIRSYYSINTKDEKRILVEHMALLLPREHQEEVELKRGDKK